MFYVLSVLAAVFSRLLPHPPNFTAMGGLAVFSGGTLSRKRALALTMVSMLISDWILSHLYGFPFLSYASLGVYVAFSLQVVLGAYFRNRPGGYMWAAFLGAWVFFLLTNFMVWFQLYPRTPSGLIACYVNALPFFKMTLAGNMVWTPIFVLVHRLFRARLNNADVQLKTFR